MPKGTLSPDGSERTSQNGYHYTKRNGSWVLTHRLVIEAKLGRELRGNERIRFKDGDRTNRDPSNLVVYTVKDRSPAARRAEIEAKIEELQAELDSLQEA